MNCEKCRWYRTIYNTKGIGNWYVYDRCLMGGCDGSQYEPSETAICTKWEDGTPTAGSVLENGAKMDGDTK